MWVHWLGMWVGLRFIFADGCVIAAKSSGAWSGTEIALVGVMLVGRWIGAIEEDWIFLGKTCEALAGPLDTKFFHCADHGDDKFVAPLETQEFVLPAGFVEKDNIEGDGIVFVDGCYFGNNLALVFALFSLNEFYKFFAEFFELLDGGAKFDGDGDCFGETA